MVVTWNWCWCFPPVLLFYLPLCCLHSGFCHWVLSFLFCLSLSICSHAGAEVSLIFLTLSWILIVVGIKIRLPHGRDCNCGEHCMSFHQVLSLLYSSQSYLMQTAMSHKTIMTINQVSRDTIHTVLRLLAIKTEQPCCIEDASMTEKKSAQVRLSTRVLLHICNCIWCKVDACKILKDLSLRSTASQNSRSSKKDAIDREYQSESS